MTGQLAGLLEIKRAGLVEPVELAGVDLQLGHPRPLGLDGQLRPILLRRQPDGRRLDPHRQVLGDQGHVAALGGEVQRDGQDPRIVVPQAEAGGQGLRVGVVELDVHGAALVVDRDRGVKPAVRDPQIVEHVAARCGRSSRARRGAAWPRAR